MEGVRKTERKKAKDGEGERRPKSLSTTTAIRATWFAPAASWRLIRNNPFICSSRQ